MPYSGNFTKVTFVKEDRDAGGAALMVEGKSRQARDALEIYVAIPHGGQLLVQRVQNATGAKDWVASFPQGSPPFAEGDAITVVGMAVLRGSKPPFFWADTLTSDPQTAPP